MSVVVAVRVRPFNQREIDLNSQLCVDMDGGTRTTLLDLTDPKKNKDFFFDYSFWSHDEFELNPEGLAIPTGSRYADQRQVYEQVGKQILDNAWLGYHCCLFAYGQTGAGKSYSMIGYGANKGIVPIACQEIFMRMEANDNPNLQQEVSCQMMEIYNETVQDLLIPVSKRPLGGLKIRQNQSLGFYVDGISKHPVESYRGIEKIMEQGTQNRTVASTQMNANSSRAHTIIIIQFKQTEIKGDRKYEKLSVINLVDLAGSEKISKTDVSGKNLKEAANINLSLTTLGKVIQALAEKEMGKNKGQVVPYRESCLTKILCNALGGNSKTLMICAVSPSSNNWEETLSTLRYADQAKKIKNKATVNESATDKLIRELSEENDKLKQFMAKFQEQFGLNLLSMDMKNIESLDPSVFNIQEVKDKKEEMEANQHLLEDTTKTKEQWNQENQIQMEEEEGAQKLKMDIDMPHLCNVHEDPQLHNKIQIALNDVIIIGSRHSIPKPDIIVGLARHNVARITRLNPKEENQASLESEQTQTEVNNSEEVEKKHITSSQFFIEPFSDQYDCNILVNGWPIKGKTEINHLDRIVINTTSMFVFVVSKSLIRDTMPTSIDVVDFDFVQDEMGAYIEFETRSREQVNAVKRIELQQESQKLSLEQQKAWDEQKQQLEQQIMQLKQKQLEELKQYQESPKRTNSAQQSPQQTKFKDKNYLEHKIKKFLPKIIEVNLIAKELKREISMSAKISQTYDSTTGSEPLMATKNEPTVEHSQEEINAKSKIIIQVDNRELGQIFIWDQDKFKSRYYRIKELLELSFNSPNQKFLTPEDDPFYDPPQPNLIGSGYFKLLYLAYFMDSTIELQIVGENGRCGDLKVDIVPCDATGEKNLAHEMELEGKDVIEDPSELLGAEMFVRVSIGSATLPRHICRDTYVEYSIIDNANTIQTHRTQTMTGKNVNPDFNYTKVHHFESISNEQLSYFQEKNLIFKVYGVAEIQQTQPNTQQTSQIPAEEKMQQQAQAKLQQQKKEQQPIGSNYGANSMKSLPSFSSALTQSTSLTSFPSKQQSNAMTPRNMESYTPRNNPTTKLTTNNNAPSFFTINPKQSQSQQSVSSNNQYSNQNFQQSQPNLQMQMNRSNPNLQLGRQPILPMPSKKEISAFQPAPRSQKEEEKLQRKVNKKKEDCTIF